MSDHFTTLRSKGLNIQRKSYYLRKIFSEQYDKIFRIKNAREWCLSASRPGLTIRFSCFKNVIPYNSKRFGISMVKLATVLMSAAFSKKLANPNASIKKVHNGFFFNGLLYLAFRYKENI